ncbi:hypothetical protein F3Y22_tig00110602pilonHSYRG00262 [Hibiscus syriacus]|uniref:Uncharacterized protein n=1 Tax=Hibiscus syriacus TaxID=106335 RepID=A0A6A3A2B1_HIBSY|nr:hypothetical protein F3Y22_tig00110602pilonHSYRG00262 [Hibiscus syriacus]
MEGGKEQRMAVVSRFMMAQQNPLEQVQAKHHASRGGSGDRHRRHPGCCYRCYHGYPRQRHLLYSSKSSLGFPQSSGNVFSQASPSLLFLSAISILFFRTALSGGPWVQARNFAEMTGVNAGIVSVMKRFRGKEDVQSSLFQTMEMLWVIYLCWLLLNLVLCFGKDEDSFSPVVCRMVAAFGSGAMFSFVSGMAGPNQAANAVTSGLLSHSFKAGFSSALRDVKIPPGPRLLILDHIQRDPELREKR